MKKVGEHITIDFLGVKQDYTPKFYNKIIYTLGVDKSHIWYYVYNINKEVQIKWQYAEWNITKKVLTLYATL